MALLAVDQPELHRPALQRAGGQLALVGAAMLVAIGFFVINRIASLEV